MDNLFNVQNLTFSYGKNKVIDDITFDIKKGIVTTLIGANGCGKSTLFNLMTKNLHADKGKILLADKNIDDIKIKDYAKMAAIVHQYNTAPHDISVKDLVSYGRTPYQSFGIPKNVDEDEEKITKALEITNTLKYKDKPVSQLSGGQKQRVWLAMALAQSTDILFLDEPTTYLDISYQLQILKLVRKLNMDFGISIIMVLHDINQALYYSDEIIAMKKGKIISKGKASDMVNTETIKTVFDVELEVFKAGEKAFMLTI